MYRIFLAEDDEMLCSLITKHLESWGYQVTAAIILPWMTSAPALLSSVRIMCAVKYRIMILIMLCTFRMKRSILIITV